MAAWVLQFVAYAALVGFATWISWGRAISLAGVTLCVCLLVTEAAYFGASFGSRATLEVMQAIVIINSARIAFNATGCRLSIVIVALSVADLAFIAVIGAGAINSRWREYVYGNVTNAIFGLQCLCVASPGIRDALMDRRARRGGRGLVGGERAALHARSSEGRWP